jgi:hypothetical protein
LEGLQPDAVYLTLVSAVAMTLITVELSLYLPATRWFGKWYARWTWQSIRNVQPFGRNRIFRDFTRAFGMVAIGGWRIVLGLYLAAILLFVGPILLTLLTFSLCFHMIHFSS